MISGFLFSLDRDYHCASHFGKQRIRQVEGEERKTRGYKEIDRCYKGKNYTPGTVRSTISSGELQRFTSKLFNGTVQGTSPLKVLSQYVDAMRFIVLSDSRRYDVTTAKRRCNNAVWLKNCLNN